MRRVGAINCFHETSPLALLGGLRPRLVVVGAGRAAADLVVIGGTLVNVQSREVLPGWQVAVAEGRFAYVGPDAAHCIGPQTRVVDATGH
ncbi:MAG: adenine deaminase, partial [Cereibacter sp.]